jgi:gluconolactonase
MPVRRDASYALIVVGLQNDLIHPDGFFVREGLLSLSDEERARVLENVTAIATAMREAECPVVHAHWQLRPDHLDASYSRQWRRLGLKDAGALVKGSWGAEPLEGLAVGEDDFILPLTSHSAFQFTHLDRILRNCGVETCVLVGGPATEGLDDSARQGAAYGYRILLPADAIYPYQIEHLQKTLSNRAHTVSTAEVLDMIKALPIAVPQPARR